MVNLVDFSTDDHHPLSRCTWSYLFFLYMVSLVFQTPIVQPECIIYASSFVLVNVRSTNKFNFKIGLRQSHSLSPFLFSIVAKGINYIFHAFVNVDLFRSYHTYLDLIILVNVSLKF